MSAASKITALLLSAAGTLTLGGAVLFGAAYGGLNGQGQGTATASNEPNGIIETDTQVGTLHQEPQPMTLALSNDPPMSAAEVPAEAKAEPSKAAESPPQESAEIAEKLQRDSQKVQDALDQTVKFEFNKTPLNEALASIASQHGVTFVLDNEGLKSARIHEDTPIDMVVRGTTLGSSLRLLLANVNGRTLDYMPLHGALVISTRERIGLAELSRNVSNRVGSKSNLSAENNPQLQAAHDSTMVITGKDIQVKTKDTQVNASELRLVRGPSDQNGSISTEHNASIVTAIRNLSAGDRKIYEALDQTTSLEFPDNKLQEIAAFISDKHNIRIRFDKTALQNEGFPMDSYHELVIADVPLSTALSMLLESVSDVTLDYYVDRGTLFVTTREAAASKKCLRFYDLSSELVNLPEVIEEYAIGFQMNEGGALELTSFGDCLAIETSFANHRKIEEMIVGVMQVAEARKAAGKEFVIPKPKSTLTRPAPPQPAPAAAGQQQPAGAVGGSGSAGGTPAGNATGGFIGGGSGGFN